MAEKATIFKPKMLGGFAQRGHRRRRKRPARTKPPLTIKQILAWADAHHSRRGQWPTRRSGRVHDMPGETWVGVCHALEVRSRGLPGGSSLAKLLAERRGVRNRAALPRLTVKQVLAWADAHHEKKGQWPTRTSGAIEGSSGETWLGIDVCMRQGFRGLPDGTSLARLLAKHRHRPNRAARPPLTIEQILKWADAHHRRMGRWPTTLSGPVVDAPDEKWNCISMALLRSERGLPGRLPLHKLLTEHRGAPKKSFLPLLTVDRVLAWADKHHRRTGQWPNVRSLIHGVPGGTWVAVNAALRGGCRGLPGGTTLRRLLVEHGRIKESR